MGLGLREIFLVGFVSPYVIAKALMLRDPKESVHHMRSKKDR